MKTNFLLHIFLFITYSVSAQEISREILTTAGDVSKNENGVSLSWTIGDVFCHTTLAQQHLTEGFQQGDLAKKSNKENPNNVHYRVNNPTPITPEYSPIEVLTYPNPTTDYLILRFESESPEIILTQVFHENGTLVLQKTLQVEDGKEVSLRHIQTINPGKYYIKFSKNGKVILTKPFIKIEL